MADYITDPMWRLWTDRPVTKWRLGGIYANKPGYHNTRAANSSGNYSVQLTLDRRGPSDKAAAIDYTMGDAEMERRTGYLAAAVNRGDPRLASVREFYGTINGSSVYGRIKNDRNGPWRSSSADSSHLWHIHISIFRAYVDDWSELEPILSVLSGESLAAWNRRGNGDEIMIGLKRGDSGQLVKGLQSKLTRAGFPPDGGVDGDYGPATAKAVLKMRRAQGSGAESGDYFSGWANTQLDDALARRRAAQAANTALKEAKQIINELVEVVEALPSGSSPLPSMVRLDLSALPDELLVPVEPAGDDD